MIAMIDGFHLIGEAASGEEALALLEHVPVQVVLLDVSMPGIGGMETARRIRTRFPTLLVVMLSAYDTESIALDAASIGCAFYPKDQFGPDELEAAMRDTLRPPE